MNSPSPADTVSSRRLFSVFMGWWQTGREVPRQPAATDSGKLDWKCSSYPSLGRRFPSSLPPFALYPTFHPPLPPVQRHIAGGGKPWLLCAHHFTPMERPVLTHWPDINASNHRPSHFEQCRSPLFLPANFFF